MSAPGADISLPFSVLQAVRIPDVAGQVLLNGGSKEIRLARK
jgi:hypothetical protein